MSSMKFLSNHLADMEEKALEICELIGSYAKQARCRIKNGTGEVLVRIESVCVLHQSEDMSDNTDCSPVASRRRVVPVSVIPAVSARMVVPSAAPYVMD